MNNFGRNDPAKQRAHAILDFVREGKMVSSQAVAHALEVLGDVDDSLEPPKLARDERRYLPSRVESL